MTDILLQAASSYKTLSQYRYYFIFGDKKRNTYHIPVQLKDENFPHLVGIDRLEDKRSFLFKEGKERVLPKILEGEITYGEIQNSPHFLSCMEKIAYFDTFSDFFSVELEKFLSFNFHKELSFSTINADILIRHTDNNHLFLKYDSLEVSSHYYIPISFLNEVSNKYTNRQKNLPFFTPKDQKLIHALQ